MVPVGTGREGGLIVRRLLLHVRLGAYLAAMLTGVAPMEAHGGDMSQAAVAARLRQANGHDPTARIEASRALFRLGPAVAPLLERAGARPMRTISASRGDVIYTLLSGKLSLADADPDTFGVHLEANVSAQDVDRMGRAHGFSILSPGQCRPDLSPACYVHLLSGKRLADVLRDVLTSEPRVTTVSLNYVEH